MKLVLDCCSVVGNPGMPQVRFLHSVGVALSSLGAFSLFGYACPSIGFGLAFILRTNGAEPSANRKLIRMRLFGDRF